MHSEQDLDTKIRMTLRSECSNISASEELKRRIDYTIHEKQEGKFMKYLSIKKLCAGTAAACLLMSCTGVFASRVVGFTSASSSVPEYTSYEEISKAEERIGYQADHVERFTNGYTFSDACIGKAEAYGETQETIYTIQSLEMTYRKPGQPDLNLNIEKKVEDIPSAKQPDAVRICGETQLRYDEYTYKFIPDSYVLTEEDRINMQKENYYISVGSDEVEIQKASHVTWEKNGISYDLFGFDIEVGADGMLDMAEEIMAAE